MADRTDDEPEEEPIRERIRSAVAETTERELVDIDRSGPQTTVVVDVFGEEDGERTRVERALYSVHEEPSIDMSDDSRPLEGGNELQWSYLGPVERTDEGWKRLEE